jgi:RimJ/RimL family protein N-acetyltransferase
MKDHSDRETPLRTARLELRPLRVDDADEMVHVLGDAALHAFTGGAPLAVDALRERYRRQVRGRSPDGKERWLNWIVRLAASDVALGYVQAAIVDEGAKGAVANVAWVVGVPWQRRGYATEAARALVDWLRGQGIDAIEAYIAAGHVASQAVAARIGLERTERRVNGEEVWSIPPSLST